MRQPVAHDRFVGQSGQVSRHRVRELRPGKLGGEVAAPSVPDMRHHAASARPRRTPGRGVPSSVSNSCPSKTRSGGHGNEAVPGRASKERSSGPGVPNVGPAKADGLAGAKKQRQALEQLRLPGSIRAEQGQSVTPRQPHVTEFL
jgi:hypothetical protein